MEEVKLNEKPMQIRFEHHGITYTCVTEHAKSLAIEMDFEGPQPNHFGTDKASRETLKLGGFVGDTKAGGGCNVDILNMIPHCNGTHTETVSHIVNEDIWVGHSAMNLLTVAVLVTVNPRSANDCKESYRPELDNKDTVITKSQLRKAVEAVTKIERILPGALIVRTMPNEKEKASRAYTEKNAPPFFDRRSDGVRQRNQRSTPASGYTLGRSNVRRRVVDEPSFVLECQRGDAPAVRGHLAGQNDYGDGFCRGRDRRWNLCVKLASPGVLQ